MFSVIFPGQGSQIVGMGKDFYNKFELVKKLFKEADDTLNFSLSKLVLDGPKEELDITINTQPAIFLISYSIFNVIKKEFDIDLFKAKYFAGHSLGEYSALSCAGYLNFSDRNNGRITGLTRFGCFEVKNGEFTGPINTMMFDETLHNIFGEKLVGLTNNQQLIIDTSTYEERSSHSSKIPGAVVNDFSLTL